MPAFEYKVVPAPAKGTKAKGVKTPEARFANSVEITLNTMAADGWEYLRAELLPSEERSGLTSSTTNWRNVLIFRRALVTADPQGTEPVLEPPAATPAPQEPQPLAQSAATDHPPARPALRTEPLMTAKPEEAVVAQEEADDDDLSASPVPGPGAVRMLKDDGVEEVSPVSGLTAALRNRATQRSDKS